MFDQKFEFFGEGPFYYTTVKYQLRMFNLIYEWKIDCESLCAVESDFVRMLVCASLCLCLCLRLPSLQRQANAY